MVTIEKIKKKGLTVEEVAKKMGLTTMGLYKKLKNKKFWYEEFRKLEKMGLW